MKKFLFTALFLTVTFPMLAQVNARLLKYPDVSKTSITFTYGGDVWVVAKTGGLAERLSSPKGEESFPKFSPDGKHIAFTGNYDGNSDIYVIPTEGGMVKRITYHNFTDRMLDWYPDGKKILFASNRYSERQRYNQFFTISAQSGMPQKLAVPYGEFASISPNGKSITYTKRTRIFRTWKRYRGGMAAGIWLFNLENFKSKKITDNNANNELPMWHKNKIYYLSDNDLNKRANIWCYNLDTETHTQITKFKNFDVHYPSLGPDDIVFEAEGKLFLLSLSDNKYKEVKINLVTDLASLKPRQEDASKHFQYIAPSPDGKRVVVQARGEIFSLPAKEGFVENISQSSSSAERFPTWSPDGKRIAYWSDKGGEYQLVLYDYQTKKAETVTSFKSGYKYRLFWSPDSKKLAYIDEAMVISIFNTENNNIEKVDQCLWKMHGALRGFSCNWSSDSRWLTYSRGLENKHEAIFLYDTKDNQKYQITSGYYSDSEPVFDPDGKYLYFTSERNFQPSYSQMEGTWIYTNSTKLMALALREDVESPLNPKNDQVEIKKDEAKKDKKDKKDKDDKKNDKKKEKTLSIDLKNIEQRAVELNVKSRNIGGINAVKGKVIFMEFPARGSGAKLALKYYDIEKNEDKEIIRGINSYDVLANKKKMIVGARGNYYIIGISPGQKLKDPIKVKNLYMELNPKAEWTQILRDAWRLERDYFYDPNMHGVEWEEVYERYSGMLKYAVSREDVNFLIGEMIGELNASHTYKGGGDMERGKYENVGYLGIDWEKDGNFYKIKKIIKGAAWDSETISPLNYPGIKVKEGDYILAVNGRNIKTDLSPYAYFQGLAGQTVELKVSSKPKLDDAKNIIVKTERSEMRLRHLAWIEKNRQRVDKATNGQIGYIYVRSTGIDGQNELVRQFYAQFNKKGLIIDERFNSGGQIPDRFIELLNRKPLAFWAIRHGKTWQHPGAANFGPKVMLINGWSGSGGDAFPTYFRMAKLGPLVGKRTWGGLIGISGAPALIDGGSVTIPSFRMYEPGGGWFPEGHGVEPDIKIDDNPTQMANGIDPQLEAGIKEVMKLLKENPPVKKINPPYEKR